MIDQAAQMGFGAILFFGRPEYYPRFDEKKRRYSESVMRKVLTIRLLWEWNSSWLFV